MAEKSLGQRMPSFEKNTYVTLSIWREMRQCHICGVIKIYNKSAVLNCGVAIFKMHHHLVVLPIFFLIGMSYFLFLKSTTYSWQLSIWLLLIYFSCFLYFNNAFQICLQFPYCLYHYLASRVYYYYYIYYTALDSNRRASQ